MDLKKTMHISFILKPMHIIFTVSKEKHTRLHSWMLREWFIKSYIVHVRESVSIILHSVCLKDHFLLKTSINNRKTIWKVYYMLIIALIFMCKKSPATIPNGCFMEMMNVLKWLNGNQVSVNVKHICNNCNNLKPGPL